MRFSWHFMSDDSPIIIVNLKAYEQGYGADGFDLCKIMEEISIEHNVNLAAAVSPIDLVDFSDNLKIPIFAQHVDVPMEAMCGVLVTKRLFFGSSLCRADHCAELC